MTEASWYARINSNFQKLFEAPFPLFQSIGSITADARLYNECLTAFNGDLYASNGTSWVKVPFAQLTFIAQLNTGTATVADIKNAYNALLADFRAKNWMV